MKAILSLDQGTTSSRAILFDRNGETLASAQREFTQHFPQPGWVEHDALEIWQTQCRVAAEVIAKSALADSDIGAIGITNQRETTVLWDRTSGLPLAPAIVWQDRRTAAYCEALKRDGMEECVREKTGLVIDSYFSGTKLNWLLNNIPGTRQRAMRGELAFGTIDTWLIWQLSGGKVHATDVSNASRTMLCNIHTLTWDDELLRAMDIPRAVLPKIVSSSEIIGETACDGLPRGLKISGVAGDQQAALFGQACHRSGMAKNTYGTGCFMLMNTGEHPVASKHKLISTVAWRLANKPAQYALEGSVFIAGAAVQWLRDGLRAIATSADVEPLMQAVPDSGGVYLVPAFVGLGAPYWDPHARGAILGLTRDSRVEHIARAAVEAMAYQTRDVLEVMQEEAGLQLPHLKVDGGAAANALLLQFQADQLGVPVRRPVVAETTALGAAYLAGLAVGYWQGLDDVRRNWALDREFKPAMGAEARERGYKGWRKAVTRSLAWADDA